MVFKEHFKSPKRADCISKHLAFQKSVNGARVYSLITKPKYYLKPDKENYNRAFNDLTNDFKRKKYEHLICSPMGCMKDKIKDELFINNVIEFLRTTQANISIITYNEDTSRPISKRNRPSHGEFHWQLKRHIAKKTLTLDKHKSQVAVPQRQEKVNYSQEPHESEIRIKDTTVIARGEHSCSVKCCK